MKKVNLISLKFRNFKKHKDLIVPFSATETDIIGTNRTGKTTIADGFSFLLYGKDSKNSKNFNIKTLQSNNEPIHHLEHEVSGRFEILDENATVTAEFELKRIYKEKWTKKKGSEESTFDTHETVYFVNDVPVSATEYKAKVDGIISEEISQLITNPLFFNTKLGWKERREILTRMAGEIADEDIADVMEASEALRSILRSGKTIAEHRKEVAARRSKLKKELEEIPARIDEVDRGMPAAKNWDELEAQKTEAGKELERIDRSINDVAEAHRQAYDSAAGVQRQKNEKQTELDNLTAELDREFNAELNKLKQTVENLKGSHSINLGKIQAKERRLQEIDAALPSIRQQHAGKLADWTRVNAQEYSAGSFDCECCGQPLPADAAERKKEEGLAGFNRSKTEELRRITEDGHRLKKQITDDEKERAELEQEIERLKSENSGIAGNLSAREKEVEEKSKAVRAVSPKETSLKAEIDAIIVPTVEPADTEALKQERAGIVEKRDSLKEELAVKTQIEMQENRKNELIQQQRTLAQQIADLDRIEMEGERFTRAKMFEVEKRTNALFSVVKFKMYNRLINQGEEETCECMIDGVPFSDLNNEGCINAGIDIINALSKFYGISAPIFIDNREAVVDLLPTSAQLVNLIVDENAKELTVSYPKK